MKGIDWSRVRHFRREEFGEADGVEPDPALVQLLDDARTMAGIPFSLTSGIRTPDRNREVGGVESSAHLTGCAVDISAGSSRERYLILDSLLICGAQRIGIGADFVHVDTSAERAQEVIWLY